MDYRRSSKRYMASDTSSAVHRLFSGRALSRAVARAAPSNAIPLLVLRLPEFAETAWQKGTRAARALERRTTVAFRAAALRIVRAEDVLAHDCGSDRFFVAVLAGSRGGNVPTAADCRLMLERLVAGIARQTGRRMESGWWVLDRAEDARDLERAAKLALERGARERERYEFLAAVGHELRTPLASIRGYLETVLDGDADAGRARRFLETARHEALRLGRMVDGMLEFSLLDLSPPALVAQSCDARECMRDAIDVLAPLARRYGVTLNDAGGAAATARIDADACMHALLNLVENAIRYGRENGIVQLSCTSDDDAVVISIDDDGGGLGGRIRGHGLGLTIARTIAERAGGDVCLGASSLGGTRALLRLPAGRKGDAGRRKSVV